MAHYGNFAGPIIVEVASGSGMVQIYKRTTFLSSPPIPEFLQTAIQRAARRRTHQAAPRHATAMRAYQSSGLTPHDVGGLEAVQSLLMKWATIGSASTLPDTIRPRIIVVTGKDNDSITQALLNEEFFLLDIANDALFHSAFADISISRHPPGELFPDARYLDLHADIARELHLARSARKIHQVLFSATHMNAFYEDGLRHVTANMFTPFDFIHASRRLNPVSGSLVPHLSTVLNQGVNKRMPYEDLVSYTASAILMDAYPPLMHGIAYEQVLGNCALADLMCQNVDHQLERLFEFMSMKGDSSSHIHRYNLNQRRKHLALLRLNSVCLVCVIRCAEYRLPCGHALCDSCVERFGEGCAGAESEYVVTTCPLCNTPTALKVRVKPSTFAARLFSIDGGGLLGIIPAELLVFMQKRLLCNLQLRNLIDYFIGTSSGGDISLDIGICQNGAEKCSERFQQLAKGFFGGQQRGCVSKLRRLAKIWTADGMYDSRALEHVFRQHYGATLRMFDTPRTMIAGWRVAVTSTSVADGTPFLFTNYNGETPLRNDCVYGCLRTMVDDEPFVWQAARATSAAPVLFPSIDIPSVGSFQDGGMKQRHNNPIRSGLSEVRRLWPRTPKPHVVISLGTGTVSRALKTSDSRNILLDGWLPRIYRSYMSSFDGEETWNELQGELDDQTSKNYFRLNYSFTGARPSIVDISAMENISRSIQKNPPAADKMEEALLTLLASSLFFELDSIPEFQNGFFRCVGTIRCYGPTRPIIRSLLALRPAHHEFYKDDINLGLYLSEDDICVEFQRYCQPVRFSVRHLQEKITMTLRSDGTALLLNGFPNATQWYIDEQGLDGVFGASNHGAPFRIQCDTCERRLNGKEKKRKYMYTR
ncbi:hypothetical protein ACJ73_05431 [Blastomyces percursus]|uniref:RING-type domain-containing protein n=1 Tax=Blastomyces percursus TaxID=1658174 RepID=A0A1J9R6G3_9EURO|nr:hypothetical protein ACJ73_05431 [Blastomyces percursus]